MVRPFPAPPDGVNYAPVSTVDHSPNHSSDLTRSTDPYENLAGDHLPDSAYLANIPNYELFNRRGSGYMPAPSVISRNSTHESLPAPGTPGFGGNRSSWGSTAGFAGAAEPTAGSGSEPSRRPTAARGQSNLAHSTLGWNRTDDRSSTDDNLPGHKIDPASAAVILNEKQWVTGYRAKSRRWLWVGIGVGVLIAIALGVGLGVGLGHKPKNRRTSVAAAANSSSSSSPSSSTASASTSSAAPSAKPTTGGQGSLITLENGSTMTYNNPFGGQWVWDTANPFNNNAQSNSWTPSLSQNWTWGIDKIYGVNLGGWLVTEPFIVSGLYEKYANGPNNQTAIDEYTLSQNMGTNITAALTEHYETFITEADIAEIASYGLNWVRIPIPFWAIETWEGEPYLEKVAWTYFLQAIQWCRKYGIRINLDFHALPGSQNGWNHSGHLGQINWMYGVMGSANAQRSLDYIRTLAQFISQPEYSPVIQLFGFVNEPQGAFVGQPEIGSFYYEAYNIIREVTGIGEGNGAFLSMHDAFLGVTTWTGFLPGADRLAMDSHQYVVFGNQLTGTMDSISKVPCQYFAVATNATSKSWGVNIAGEWSAATNDCGKWVNAVGLGSRYDGTFAGYNGPSPGSCDLWNDYTQWNASLKADLYHFAAASMDSFQNHFYWTWKIGNSTIEQPPQVNPIWNFQLGLQQGWIPTDPRTAVGICAGDGYDSNEFDGTYSSPWMTGGVGANIINAGMSSSYPWPAASFNNIPAASMSLIAQYTQTGTPVTLPVPTFTSPSSSATIGAGNGWFNPNAGGRQAYAAISGCTYPSEYEAPTSVAGSYCGAGLVQPTKRDSNVERPVFPAPTPAPRR